MLRSTMKTVSAPAISSFRGSIPHPTHALRTLGSALPPPHATLASRRPATALPGSDLHRLIAPALPGAFLHSITSSAWASSVAGTSMPSALAVCRFMTNSNLVGCRPLAASSLCPAASCRHRAHRLHRGRGRAGRRPRAYESPHAARCTRREGDGRNIKDRCSRHDRSDRCGLRPYPAGRTTA
jgi:hypothetical protein